MTTRRKAWMIRPAKKPTSTLPDTLKAEVEAKSSDLIANVLKPKHVRPSQEDERFNYISDIGMVMIEFGLSDANSFFKVFVGELGVQDFVAVVFQEGRLGAARHTGPAVEEEDYHDVRTRLRFRAICCIS